MRAVSESLYNNNKVDDNKLEVVVEEAPLIIGLEPTAIIDYMARVDWSLLDGIIIGEPGGSIDVSIEELEHILREVERYSVLKMAGGSVSNTIRGLSAGFGVSCGLVGAYGDDEQGRLYVANMSSSGVDVSRLRAKKEPTGRCVVLVEASSGRRTPRPCFSNVATLQAEELNREDFKGSKWLVVRFGIYSLEITKAAIKIAKQEGVSVSMDLASFVTVRDYRRSLVELLESGDIDLCFGNEDEALELVRDHDHDPIPGDALEFLGEKCKWAVVTLGPNGCMAKHGGETVRVAATGDGKVIDTTGAGDLFMSGFLYGLVKGLSLEDCCKVGSCGGGSVVRSLGAQVTPENWHWMAQQMQIQALPLPPTTTTNWSDLNF
ncbi:hypothetical protein Ddye_010042 [Dipteronia dyeriana]|uniref:Carbohydrate kinase PfkB domain-containing protein n=1 Tax=Dipteronia dyeriana TaxID=168575 RepID=A0AAD9XCT2_9ROSI|nr:hypothetical protein Ddye_010042 [Dipteronia dyeriana]